MLQNGTHTCTGHNPAGLTGHLNDLDLQGDHYRKAEAMQAPLHEGLVLFGNLL